jgi:dTDP-4-amino-4,6-dideoxygalactose transaminase
VRTGDVDKLAQFLRQRGIVTARHYPELPPLSAAYEDLNLREGMFPVAEAIARECISLPLFPGITEAQLERVVTNIVGFFA